jgi:two-component system chemotaxis sensor kinase CheA
VERLRSFAQNLNEVEQVPVLTAALVGLDDVALAGQPMNPEFGETQQIESTGQEDLAKPEAQGKEDAVTRHSAAVDSSIRVGVGLLDKLMDLVGELVLTRNQILSSTAKAKIPRSMRPLSA